MKKVLTATVLAAALGLPAAAQDASVSGDPFVADQSLAALGGLGTAGTAAAVLAGVIVLGVIIEASDDDDDDDSTTTTTTTN